MPRPVESEDVVLTPCLHIATFKPVAKTGDVVWCRRCSDYRTVGHMFVEWRARCTTGRCVYSRGYGEDEHRARVGAVAHARKFASHVVVVMHGQVEMGKVGGDEPLPTTIGWVRAHPDHQRSLRSLP